MEFRRFGRFILKSDYYRIFTWKGYEHKDLANTDPLFLNAQGDKGNATLLVVNPRLLLTLGENVALNLSGSYYYRDTFYKYHNNVKAKTYEVGLGLTFRL